MPASELHGPWLLLLLAAPLGGAVALRRISGGEGVRRAALASASVALVASTLLFIDHLHQGSAVLVDPLLPAWSGLGGAFFEVDELSAWLLPFGALVFGVALLVAPRRALGDGLAARLLLAEALVLATFACRRPEGIALFWSLSIAPVFAELRGRGEGVAVVAFRRHMTLAILLLVGGVLALALAPGDSSGVRTLALGAVIAGVAVRKGIFPVHSWVAEFFASAPLGAAVLFCAPQLGAYALVRIAVPEAPAWLLHGFGSLALVTAVYGSGTALVQEDPRRSFGCLFLSQSALVMAGLDCTSVVGLSGGLALWISCGLALAGFGLTLWVLEARRGALSLARFNGGYERTTLLATCFLVFGLASVGLPGTLGFVGQELLLDGSVEEHPYSGSLVAIATALNGIAVVRMYFHLFCGARDHALGPQWIRTREAYGLALVAALLLLGGVYPGPFVDSRARVAEEILRLRSLRASGHLLVHPPADLRHDGALPLLLHDEVDLVADREALEDRGIDDGEGHRHRHHQARDLVVLERDQRRLRVHAADHAAHGLRCDRRIRAASL
jgi:NADH-quinone oxidoreductase subunit M